MTAFDYLSVLLSIVLGLGITQLLAAFGRCLEHRRSIVVHAPAFIWAAFLLFLHVQTWWSMFGLRHWEDWTFLQFSMVLLQPIVLFLLTTLVLPGPGSAELDLKANYISNRRWFFGLLLALIVVSLAKDLVRQGRLPDPINLGFHAALTVTFLAGLIFKGPRAHLPIAFTGLALMVSYIVLLFAELA